MSGIEVVGALAACSQIGGQAITLLSTLSEIREKMKNGPGSIREQDLHIQQFIDLATEFQRCAKQNSEAKNIINSALSSAVLLHSGLQNISISDTDGKFKRATKSLRWKLKEGNLEPMQKPWANEEHPSFVFAIRYSWCPFWKGRGNVSHSERKTSLTRPQDDSCQWQLEGDSKPGSKHS